MKNSDRMGIILLALSIWEYVISTPAQVDTMFWISLGNFLLGAGIMLYGGSSGNAESKK